MRILLVLFLALVFRCASAEPFAVQVGEARLALDAPPGFSDTQFTGSPRLIELAESLTPPANRIVLFALEDGDLRRFTLGDPLQLRRMVLAATPRAMEREWLTPAAFKAFAAEVQRDEGAPAAPVTDVTRYLDSQPIGRANAIASLRANPDVLTTLLGARTPPRRENEPPRYLVSTHTVMLVRGKVLDLLVYSRYESAADLEWIRTATARWIEELQRLNLR